MNLTLTRRTTGDAGTFGHLVMPDGIMFATGELPWRDNAPQKSCIPVGSYPCAWFNSPAHGWTYLLEYVPGRSMIEIHAANWFGDKDKGYRADMLGCIGLGLAEGVLSGQHAIVRSVDAMKEFNAVMAGRRFTLTIVESFVP